MIELIYNFILNNIIGDTQLKGVDDLALLLTYTVIVIFFALLVKLVVWCFNVPTKAWGRWRD